MNVNGEIIIDEAENALAIPAQALQRGNVVYVQDDSVTEAQGNVPAGFRSVEVETGLISEDYVEIKSGLSEGDVVYIDPTTSTDSTTMMGMGGMPGGGMPSGGGGMPGGGGGMPGGGGGGRGGREVDSKMAQTHTGTQPLISLQNIYKIYQMGDMEVRANDGISLDHYQGARFVSIVGKSRKRQIHHYEYHRRARVPTEGNISSGRT